MGNPAPKELRDAPALPLEVSYLWRTFVSLKNASSGPISYSEIAAYAGLTGDGLTPSEIDVIRELDIIYIKEQAKQ